MAGNEIIECSLRLGPSRYAVRSDREFITATKQPNTSLPTSSKWDNTLRKVMGKVLGAVFRRCYPDGVLNRRHWDDSGTRAALYDIDRRRWVWVNYERLKTVIESAPNRALLHGFIDDWYCVRGTHGEYYAALSGQSWH